MLKKVQPWRKNLKNKGLRGEYVVMVPGARWETKVWPPENYAKLAQMIIKGGASVVLAGGPDDAPRAKKSSKAVNRTS